MGVLVRLSGYLMGSLGLSWGRSGGSWGPSGVILRLSRHTFFHQDFPRGLPKAIWVDLGSFEGHLGDVLRYDFVIFVTLEVTLGTFQSLLGNFIRPQVKIRRISSAQGQLWLQNRVPFGAYFLSNAAHFL